MIKKVLIGLVVVMLVAVVYVAMFPKKKVTPPPAPAKKVAVTKPWDGSASTTSAAQETFVRGAQEMTFVGINYSGLDRGSATAVVTMKAAKPSNNKPPLWMTTPNQITARSVVGTTYKPVTQIHDLGSSYQETLTFRDLPVTQLVQSQIGLIVRSQTGPFSIGLTPPPPPPGHSYAENISKTTTHKVVPAKPAIAYSKHRTGKHSETVRFFARSNTGIARLVVKVGNRRHVIVGHGRKSVSSSYKLARGRHVLIAVARGRNGKLSKTLHLTVRVP